MESTYDILVKALQIIADADDSMIAIVGLSLQVTFSALCISGLFGILLGGLLAITPFRGRGGVIAILNALMSVPTVAIGLLVYLMLSRSGPMGALGLLYTPSAMIIAQSLLLLPLIAALSRQILASQWTALADLIRCVGATRLQALSTIIYESRIALITVLLTAMGRGIAEVGAVMITGGNIAHHTRTMTTAMVLETSKGNLSTALALGIVLVLIALVISLITQALVMRHQIFYLAAPRSEKEDRT